MLYFRILKLMVTFEAMLKSICVAANRVMCFFAQALMPAHFLCADKNFYKFFKMTNVVYTNVYNICIDKYLLMKIIKSHMKK